MNNKKILLTDDSELSRRKFSEILVAEGYEVDEAGSGIEMISMLEKQKYNLILLDINMPGLSGFEALRLIKTNPSWKDIPVLALTGISKSLDDVHALQGIGADGFIDKEIDKEDFIFRIKTVLENKQ
jgi:two-component system cell cycle response regulator DivK